MERTENEGKYPKAYACYNKDIDVRLDSTSGGVFSAIAEYIITDLKGSVFGAAFDESFNVVHKRIDSIDGLKDLRGSKYPQSDIKNCYKETKELLVSGEVVLFVGTPCQIQGLKKYLSKNYDNLFCLDFICHGVASNGVWSEYVSFLSKRKRIQKIVFKNKYRGWKKWYFKVEYADGSSYLRRGRMTEFMRSYLDYVNIRPSCFDCQFKGLKRNSDFTMSDCWGTGEKDNEMNDNNGLSAFLINTSKGDEILDAIMWRLEIKQYDPEILMKDNWTAFNSVSPNDLREDFFSYCSRHSAMSGLKKFFKPSIFDWIVYYYRRFCGVEK